MSIELMPEPKAKSRDDIINALREVLDIAFKEKIDFLEITVRSKDKEKHYMHIDGVYRVPFNG